MKHVTALIIKFIMVAVILGIILSLFHDVTLADILYLSLAVTVIAYIVGDLIILPRFNNTTATVVDIILAFIVIYSADSLWISDNLSFISVLIASLVLGAGEWFFHKYVANNVFPDRGDGTEV